MTIQTIDQRVFEIWKVIIGLHNINPINQQEQKEIFFESNFYNPEFIYLDLNFDPKKFISELKLLKKPLKNETIIEHLLSKKIDKLIIWLNLLDSRGSEKFTKHSIDHYNKPSTQLVSEAKKLLELKDEKQQPKNFTSLQTVKFLKKEVQRLNLDWQVKKRANLGARADDVISESTLYIKKGEMFSSIDLQRLSLHELGVHSTRAFNAKKQKYRILEVGTSNYETTEEGLATVIEERNNLLSNSTLKNYAGRVLAVHLSLTNSFRKVFNELSNHFPKNEAYQLTMRAKRGLKDTSKKGAFTKDHIYLKGRNEVKKIKDLKPLFQGRIAVEDLEFLE